MILADTKFEFGLDEDGELVVGDEVLTPDSSRYWPAEGFEAGRGQPSFDKQYVRDWAAAQRLGQAAARAGDPRGRRRRAPARATSRPTSGSPASRSRRGSERTGSRVRARVLIRPKAGILDPQGAAVERALPALGFAGVANVHVGRLVELDVEDPGAAGADVREAARQPARRGLRGRAARRRRLTPVKFGVLQFPGSCDEVDALGAARRVGDAELIWHGDRDLRGADAIVVPGGFSYGDYLRAGAIARFSPGDGVGDRASPPTAASCWGSATAFRCSARRGCCRARCCRTRTCASPPAGRARGRCTPAGSFTRACALGERLSIPAKHAWGRYYADRAHARGDGQRRPGRAALRRRGELQRLGARHRGRVQRGAATCSA